MGKAGIFIPVNSELLDKLDVIKINYNIETSSYSEIIEIAQRPYCSRTFSMPNRSLIPS